MKKTLILAALAFAALPAFAASTTVEFTNADGSKTVIQFKDDGTSLIDGTTASTYTSDEAAKKICGKMPDGSDVCATFESWGSEVGHSTKYSATNGNSGTAVITSVEK